jgi:neutral trehalase
MPRKSRFAVLAAALLGITGVSAHAAATEELTSSWANVNICNAGQLGARAQLAGDGSTDTMRVRFTAQWLSPDGWVPLAGEATSPWQEAGSAEFTWAQAGWTFNISVPEGVTAYQLRAVAEMDLGSGRTATQTTGTCAIGG